MDKRESNFSFNELNLKELKILEEKGGSKSVSKQELIKSCDKDKMSHFSSINSTNAKFFGVKLDKYES